MHSRNDLSIWQMPLDSATSYRQVEGSVTGAAASRLGAHVGAKISQLQSARSLGDISKLNLNNTFDYKSTHHAHTKTSNHGIFNGPMASEVVVIDKNEATNNVNEIERVDNLEPITSLNSKKLFFENKLGLRPYSQPTKPAKTDCTLLDKIILDNKIENIKSVSIQRTSENQDLNKKKKQLYSPTKSLIDKKICDTIRPQTLELTNKQKTHFKIISTPEQQTLDLELTLTVSDMSPPLAVSNILTPIQRMRIGLEPVTGETQSSKFVNPNLMKIISKEEECNTVPVATQPPSPIISKTISATPMTPDYDRPPERAIDSKRGSFFSSDNLEAISLKLDALVVNSEYLESCARDGQERHELEMDAARTQASLDDVKILERDDMKERVARAARALYRCRLLLEERAPSVATHEPGFRRRSSSMSEQVVRSVAFRVLALDSRDSRRESADSRRGSALSLDGRRRDSSFSIDTRRGSMELF